MKLYSCTANISKQSGWGIIDSPFVVNLEKIFDPGFSSKGVGIGTGLGFSITYKIIEDKGGTISVKSKPDKGTTFVIKLPLVRFPMEEN